MDKPDFEYLSSYSTRAEAESIKKLLEDNGVECILKFDEIGDVMESVGADSGPTELYVAPGHLEKARELIGVEGKE